MPDDAFVAAMRAIAPAQAHPLLWWWGPGWTPGPPGHTCPAQGPSRSIRSKPEGTGSTC
jgi:hypothetical protein